MEPEATDADRGTMIEGLLGAYVRAAKGAFSANTERAVRADLGIYTAWCAAQGRAPLPATPDTIAAFVDAMAATRAPATVRRYVASIAVAHRAIGSATTPRSPAVKLALQRMHRRKGRRQAQALGLTWPLRECLLGATGDRLIDARNRALLAVAYDTLLRRSELAALRVADLTTDKTGAATVLVRNGKTDAEGRGAQLYLARDSMGDGGRVAGAKRRRRRAAVSFAAPRAGGRGARPEPDPAHLQGDGKAGRARGGDGRVPVRS